MDPLTPRRKKGPEAEIQDAIEKMLRGLEWYVMRTHGSMYQSGFPDIYATHCKYGQRWIEVKLPEMKGSKFTPAQLECFPKLCAHGSGVWILTGDSDVEYRKLFGRFNWWQYTGTWK